MDTNTTDDWKAYCLTCDDEIHATMNGVMAEAAAKDHVKANPDHRVIVGKEYFTVEDRVPMDPEENPVV